MQISLKELVVDENVLYCRVLVRFGCIVSQGLAPAPEAS